MYPISLADELHIKKVDTATITIFCTHPDLPVGEENVAYRAAALFLKEQTLQGGIQIEIIKHIPLAAGLGGGSSDAAAILKAMDILWNRNLPLDGLMEMGAQLGADVPFFMFGKGAIMGGRGERVVKPLPPLTLWMLLVNPGWPLSTKEVYEHGKWGLTKNRGDNRISMLPQDLEKMGTFLQNDLEGPALELMPAIGHIKERMIEVEASGVLMTGSGPTVFGLFTTESEAQRAARDLKMEEEGWVSFVAHVIPEIEVKG